MRLFLAPEVSFRLIDFYLFNACGTSLESTDDSGWRRSLVTTLVAAAGGAGQVRSLEIDEFFFLLATDTRFLQIIYASAVGGFRRRRSLWQFD
jgi:hypothetical protein